MSERSLKVAPSLLAANFAVLSQEVQRMESAGADLFHVDVMDGHFVPNLTIGPTVVQAVRESTTLPLDVHLMIQSPERFIERFAKAGASGLTIHVEAAGKQTPALLQKIRGMGLRSGLALSPDTPLSKAVPFLPQVDMVLLMTVHPGFGGQSFLPSVLPKIAELRVIFQGDIEVDGGINAETARQAVEKGANVLVAGTYLFKAADPKEAIQSLRKQGSQK